MSLRYAKIALRFLPLCLLGAVFWREKPWQVQLSSSIPWAIAATVFLNFGVLLPIKAARWRVALSDPPPFPQVFAATMEGLLASAAIGFGSGDVVRSARLREHTQRLPADYACTWAERGAEVLALAILVFIAALTTRLAAFAMVLSALVVMGYLALLASGRRLVPRLGAWPRLQRPLAAGLSASTPKRVAGMAALSLAGWGSEIVMLVLFQSAFHLNLSFQVALLDLGRHQRGHRHSDLARELWHLRGRRHHGARHVRRSARRRGPLCLDLPPDSRHSRRVGGHHGVPGSLAPSVIGSGPNMRNKVTESADKSRRQVGSPRGGSVVQGRRLDAGSA